MNQKQIYRPTSLDVSRLIDVSGQIDRSNPKSANRAYVDRERGWVIQIWNNSTPACDGTPWQGTLQVSIKHAISSTPKKFIERRSALPITWDDLQAIKDHFWPERIAVEVFPPRDQIVNEAEMRWLWVLPKGAQLPFNLSGSSHVLKS